MSSSAASSSSPFISNAPFLPNEQLLLSYMTKTEIARIPHKEEQQSRPRVGAPPPG
ncbi:hypothetical protein PAT3040_00028 [Paenibacillus agaridevorans]|uniref:Uncharacterized protein n=1 Tax=Paenibacillus agaridevorans TaxID=171404 RepID=A0A2R5EGB0_9BACL|nr:hypothetical protein PAT3040_00028 [Paenibacillus agaridevorans]